MTLMLNLTTRWIKYLFVPFLFLLITGCSSNPNDYDEVILDGVASLNLNKPERAVNDFSRAIALDSSRADGYLGRANAQNTLGQYEKAVADYDRAIAIDPNLANAYVNRGIAHSHLGKIEAAIADYEKGLELDPEIDDPPGIVKRLFDNVPNRDKGIRKHLKILKEQLNKGNDQQTDTDTAENDASSTTVAPQKNIA